MASVFTHLDSIIDVHLAGFCFVYFAHTYTYPTLAKYPGRESRRSLKAPLVWFSSSASELSHRHRHSMNELANFFNGSEKFLPSPWAQGWVEPSSGPSRNDPARSWSGNVTRSTGAKWNPYSRHPDMSTVIQSLVVGDNLTRSSPVAKEGGFFKHKRRPDSLSGSLLVTADGFTRLDDSIVYACIVVLVTDDILSTAIYRPSRNAITHAHIC